MLVTRGRNPGRNDNRNYFNNNDRNHATSTGQRQHQRNFDSNTDFRANDSRRNDSRNNSRGGFNNNNFRNHNDTRASDSRRGNDSFRDQQNSRGSDFHHQQGNRGQGGNAITCFNCNRQGHKVSFCPFLQNNVEQGNFVNERGSKRSDDDDDFDYSPSKRRKLDRNAVSPSYCEDDVALTSSINEIKTKNEWYIDSAASSHMVNDKDSLHDYKHFEEPSNVLLGDNTCIPAVGQGKIDFTSTDSNGNESDLNLEPVLYVPALAKNLISVRSITENEDAVVVFDRENCTVYKNDEKFVIGSVSENGKLYKMNKPPKSIDSANVVLKADRKISGELWHCRLCHVNSKYMERMFKDELVEGFNFDHRGELPCEPCVLGKMHKMSCPKESQYRSSQLLEMIHTDVCGPMQVDSEGGSRYLVTFTDDYSRYTTVYFMKHKSEVLEKFQQYTQLVETG